MQARFICLLAGFSSAATCAVAGGVERGPNSVAILFEEGNYAEVTLGYGSPDVSGTAFGGASGNMLGSYLTYSLGIKQSLSDKLDFAIIMNEPIGADVDYAAGTGYALAGTTANLQAAAITGLLRYKMPSNISVYGGLRAEQAKGDVTIIAPLVWIPFYNLSTDRQMAWGYLVGAAWEKPEIAARVALTYVSPITHTLQSVENGNPTGSFETEVPQSLNLEFETGIAADTLLFGSVRWQDWSAFDISPAAYTFLVGSPLVSYQSDRISYSLGIGRKFSDTWSGAVTLGYEPSNGDVTGNLGPVDGYKSIGLAASYTHDNIKITGGVSYYKVGDAVTNIGASFTDNSAVAAGVRVGVSF